MTDNELPKQQNYLAPIKSSGTSPAMRALVMIAVIGGFLGFIFLAMGLSSYDGTAFAIVGGILFNIGGISTLIALGVSALRWHAK